MPGYVTIVRGQSADRPLARWRLWNPLLIAAVGIVLPCVGDVAAAATKPAPSRSAGPIYQWGVYQDCTLDSAATDAVSVRLQQMGESVQAVSPQTQSAECVGSDCVRRLHAEDGAAQRGWLFGGSYRIQTSGEISSRLWVANLSTGEATSSSGSCLGCDIPELLARQAANLLEKAPASTVAPTLPESATATGSFSTGSASSASASPPVATSLKRVVLAISAQGDQVDAGAVRAVATAANKTVRQMGYEVVSGKEIAIAGATQSRLDITIVRDKATRSSSVLLRHTDPGGAQTTLNIDCSAPSCQTSQMERLARMNIGILLDTTTPASSYPMATRVTTEPARLQLQDPVECRPKLAGLQDVDPSAAANPAVTTPAVEDPRKDTSGQSTRTWHPYATKWRIIGGVLAGATLVTGLGLSIWLGVNNGAVDSGQECVIGALKISCIVDTTRNRNLAIGLSAVGLSSLGLILAFPTSF